MRLFSIKGKNLEDFDFFMFVKFKLGRVGKSRYEVNRFQYCFLLLFKLDSFIGIFLYRYFLFYRKMYDDYKCSVIFYFFKKSLVNKK